MRWISLGALSSVTIVACASQRSAQPMAPAAAQVLVASSPQHDEIARLSQQIAEQRSTLGLAAPPPHLMTPETPMTPMTPMTGGNAGCVRSAASTCAQSCTLSDTICENAKKICDIAKQLPGDTWAQDKCSEGAATCDQARAACCACT